jgi:hypothetical protein
MLFNDPSPSEESAFPPTVVDGQPLSIEAAEGGAITLSFLRAPEGVVGSVPKSSSVAEDAE